MKKLLCAAVLFLAMTSLASAAWVYPPVVVQSYYPVGPVYAYPPSVYVAPAPAVVEGVLAPVVPAARVYSYPYVVGPRYFVPGQPLRNRIRANRLWYY